jgi:type I restriction enzyme, S subunit
VNWPKTEFENLYEIPSRNGLNRPERVRGSGYKMINMGELFTHDRIGNIEMELVPMDEKELKTMLVEKGDLLFARQSLILAGAGKCSIVKEAEEATTFESHIIRVRLNKEIANPEFYYYYFKSPLCGIKTIVTQGVQAGIRGNDLKLLPVHLPPLIDQDRIAGLISNYDDLIENNRRRMALLEESARQLYREWFVRLRFPGYEHTRIIDGVPEGWERAQISDLCSFLGRGISPRYDDDGEYFVVNQKCIRNRLLSLEPSRRQSKEFKPERALRHLDVLINSTGTGTLGRVAQCWITPEKTTIDSHVTIARPRSEIFPRWFGYAVMELQPMFEEMGEGATNQKELSKGRIGTVEILLPVESFRVQFSDFASGVTRQVTLLSEQNTRLRAARDILLPRLMSGEIAV